MTDFAVFANGVDQKQVLDHLISQLRQSKLLLAGNKPGTISQKVTTLPRALTAVFTYLEQKGLEPSGDNQQQSYIEEVITYLQKLPIVSLRLAFEPNEEFVKTINQVLSAEVGQKILLDIIVDPRVVAGAKFEFGGKFADYSYDKKSDEFLAAKLNSFFENSEVEPA